MTTDLVVHPEPVLEDPTGGAHRVTHWMCCEEKRGSVAFCGTALGDDLEDLPEEILPDCVVCEDFVNGTPMLCPYDGQECPPELETT